jgi:hypothetical protein
MPNIDDFMDDFHAYKSTSGGSSGGSSGGGGKGPGCFWVVIVIFVVLIIFFIADGASWDAIEELLGLGLLVFLFFRWRST